MSILANITVIRCDRCQEIIVLASPEDREKHNTEWFLDVVFDFCPKCRVKAPAASDATDIEQFLTEAELEKIF